MRGTLHLDRFGRLVYRDDAGSEVVGVEATRSFPVSDPDRGIALLDRQGREVVWIERLADVSPETRVLLERELSRRHFLPVVTRIASIDGLAEPTLWHVETDRGPAQFRLKSEEDVRRVAGTRVLVVDTQGIRYLIPDYRTLDLASRRLLERYI